MTEMRQPDGGGQPSGGELESTSQPVSRRGLLTLGAGSVAAAALGGPLLNAAAAQAASPQEDTLRRMGLPFTGPVTQRFGNPQSYGPHRGTDFGVPQGTVVGCAGAGIVAVNSFSGPIGNYLIIDHANGVRTRYHMLRDRSPLQQGTPVRYRQVIGYAGQSGSTARGPHLHFELHLDGVPVDPMKRLSAEGVPDPETPPIDLGEDDMIRIQSTGRGIALIGPGYYRHLANAEEVEQSSAIISKHLNGNDRQFDVWVALAVQGRGAAS